MATMATTFPRAAVGAATAAFADFDMVLGWLFLWIMFTEIAQEWNTLIGDAHLASVAAKLINFFEIYPLLRIKKLIVRRHFDAVGR